MINCCTRKSLICNDAILGTGEAIIGVHIVINFLPNQTARVKVNGIVEEIVIDDVKE
jgi:hypothetical protein